MRHNRRAIPVQYNTETDCAPFTITPYILDFSPSQTQGVQSLLFTVLMTIVAFIVYNHDHDIDWSDSDNLVQRAINGLPTG